MTADWLIDKSALVRLASSPDGALWLERIERGMVRVASVTLLQMGFSATSGPDWRRALDGVPLSKTPTEYLTPRAEERAVSVQGLLAERGHHRAVKVPDLLIAALGELAGLVVVHVDKDFELIAAITGQDVERLAGEF